MTDALGPAVARRSAVFGEDALWAAEAARAIWRRMVRVSWAGFDPYDASLASRVPRCLLATSLRRRLLTQVAKRAPVMLQPVLGVASEVDAYTLGHGVLAATRLIGNEVLSHEEIKDETLRMIGALREMAVSRGASVAWGYHFPVDTRFFAYAPPTPNLIVTAFVVKGLAAATRTGLADCSREIRGAARFITDDLPRVADGFGECVGYVPGEEAVVHNANLLAAMTLCSSAELCGREEWINLAVRLARYTAARQADDGSWPYSEESYGRWVDGFHTGFVLEGLAAVVRVTGDVELGRALRRGVAYYVAQLFGARGEPKYYPGRPYPYDALSAAQGLETLRVVLGGPHTRFVPGQLEWIRRQLVRPNGRVAYQVHRGWTDWREFPRWASAPLLSALAGVAGVTRSR